MNSSGHGAEYRSGVLSSFGATAPQIEELLLYNKNVFVQPEGPGLLALPLPDEPFAAAWEGYAAEAGGKGAWQVLRNRLVQFSFPIRQGISRSDSYRTATLRLGTAEGMPGATGLVLEKPDRLELSMHRTPAGRIPIILTGSREDFVALVRALTAKNEPARVPESMGAVMVTGYNNWDRIFSYKNRWRPAGPEESWSEEFKRIIPQRELYQDRFIILSDGPYSAAPARDMGLAEEEWREASLVIRREHECAHYVTGRLFSSMRANVTDELLADYMGIAAAAGHFKASWFLRFVGLENFPHYREGGRLQNYRGDPPLSDGAFRILQALVKRAAENLEMFDRENRANRTLVLAALSRLTLEALASPQAPSFLRQALNSVGRRYVVNGTP
ncbi:hypothetical protein DCCM_4895 [Desulfocucumis palustris]|uniref:Uncharacterized protein n=1 Tax=Desulfocucumis palustris TaxID=1898651 RepID=A0A2L2XHW4_9FIRM|nr:hypothetical protein [Desulfocucumis palustris]GBF35760.1 hypothetical protein DCCM_4895 [Desulfocucumis palustris]